MSSESSERAGRSSGHLHHFRMVATVITEPRGRGSTVLYPVFVAWGGIAVEANGVFSNAVGLSTLLASTQLLAGLSIELTSA